MREGSRRTKRSEPKRSPLDAEWEDTFFEVHWPAWLALKPLCSRAAALKAWNAIPHPDGQADFDKLDAAFETYRKSREGEDPRWTKDASTWLNDYHRNLDLEGR